MMGVGIVGIREVAAYKSDKQKLSEVFCGLFLLNTITTCIALGALVIAVFTVEQLREHWQLMVVGAMKLMTNYMLIEWLYKGLEEFKFITIRTIIVKIAYVFSVFILVKEQDDYIMYYLLTVLMIVFNALINILYSRHYVTLSPKGINLRKYLKPFLSLGVYGVLTSMYTTFNVAYLGFVAGETEVGYYSTASKLYHIFIALFTAFTGVMLPRMSSLLSDGKVDEFKKYLTKSVEVLFFFSIPVVIIVIVYAPIIISFIAGEGYEGAVLPMRIIMPLIIIVGYEQIIIIQGLMPLKQDKAILRNSILGAVTGIILNIVLVSSFKSVGSSMVWIISEIVVLMSAQYYICKCIDIQIPWKTLIKNIGFNIPLIGIVYGIYVLIDNIWLSSLISCFLLLCYEIALQYFFPNKVIINLIKHAIIKK